MGEVIAPVECKTVEEAGAALVALGCTWDGTTQLWTTPVGRCAVALELVQEAVPCMVGPLDGGGVLVWLSDEQIAARHAAKAEVPQTTRREAP